MRIEIRRVRRADVDRILAIEASSFGREAWDRALFDEALNDCSPLFLIAKLRGRIAGYSLTCFEGRAAELASIAVLPEARRHGVAGALVHHTLDKLHRRRVAVLRLMVRTKNRTAIKFYKGFGFRRVRTVRDYYGSRKDGWRMELKLCRLDTPPDSPNPRSG